MIIHIMIHNHSKKFEFGTCIPQNFCMNRRHDNGKTQFEDL